MIGQSYFYFFRWIYSKGVFIISIILLVSDHIFLNPKFLLRLAQSISAESKQNQYTVLNILQSTLFF